MIYSFFSETLTLILISRVALRLAQQLKNSTLFATFFEVVCQNRFSTIVIIITKMKSLVLTRQLSGFLKYSRTYSDAVMKDNSLSCSFATKKSLKKRKCNTHAV